MSVFHLNNSSKNILRNNITPIKSIQNKRGYSVENNLKKSQNKSLYKKNDYNKNLLILNYIMKKSGKKNSLRTTCSDSVFESDNKKYDLSMINKHEEDLNSSLSFISEFDLEKDDYKELNDSFSSENNEDSVEVIDIAKKNRINLNKKRNEEDDIDIKLDKDFIEIKKNLLNMHEL